MANEALISLTGFVATQPKKGQTKGGTQTVSMRVGWTPRAVDKTTGEWTDQASSFLTVECYGKLAEHAGLCLRRGDPIVVRGNMRIREYVDQNGQRRSAVEVDANSIGHDMWRGISTLSKLPTRKEMTAEEYERSLAAAATRTPLPGDADPAESGAGQEPDPGAYEDAEFTGEDPADQADEPGSAPAAADPELTLAHESDEEPVEPMAGADDSLETVGARPNRR